MSGITKNRKRVTAANANKKQKKSKKKVSISAAELEEMVGRLEIYSEINMIFNHLLISYPNWIYPVLMLQNLIL